MRLEKIKLAGFKSFVDPTVVPLPGNLVGIVGPNGCGKSNIIDAVRWVMGESSARHLRGGTMADVIFNGSSSRKPVGMAHVELVFDNSEGRAPGEFAKYREISIKRQVGRDGQSVYLLNGTRCRRKDITDLFLGTGLGARSYAIIEQGTISRLIEAKPDELRAVIEEAAGISRYKDRRHETELRMEHTRDNLARLDDLREEVGKQLNSLQRQAKKAEKYQALKEEELRYKAQLLAMRWHRYDQQFQIQGDNLASLELTYRQLVTEDNELLASLSDLQNRLESQRESLNEIQGRYYEAGLAIGRLEHVIDQAQKTHEQLQRERIRMETEQAEALHELEQDRLTLTEIREALRDVGLELEHQLKQEALWVARRKKAHDDLAIIREALQSRQLLVAGIRHDVHLHQTRVQQLEQQHRQLEIRRQRLETEREELEDGLDQEEMDSLSETLQALAAERQESQEVLAALALTLQSARDRLRQCQQELNETRAQLHGLNGVISSLETLQHQAMGKNREGLADWLNHRGLTCAPRLVEQMRVESGWERAVESVLGSHLEALCVEDITACLPDGELPGTAVALYETRQTIRSGDDPATDEPWLFHRVSAPWPLHTLLSGIYCVDDWGSAQTMRHRLGLHQRLVMPDGRQIGPNWVVIPSRDDGTSGLLQRERELRESRLRVDSLTARLQSLESQQNDAERDIQQAEQDRKITEIEERRLGNEASRVSVELGGIKARHVQTQRRLDQLTFETDDLEENRFTLAEQMAEAREMMQDAVYRLQQDEPETEKLTRQRQEAETDFSAIDAELQTVQATVQETRSRLESLRVKESLTLKQRDRAENLLNQATQRLEAVSARLDEGSQPLDAEQADLLRLREARAEIEQTLDYQRKKVRASETELRQLGENRLAKERALAEIRHQLEQIKGELQANEIRRQTVQEQFDELNLSPQAVMADLPDEADEKQWQQRVTQLAEELAQLGAVNLTAMEEYQEQAARMAFLEEQHRDLSDSLDILQQAMEKIDQECRSRFRETFDKVNQGLQGMFPRLFGGGQAYLELTERDLLDAGVTIMARPPGKRNSSIHLLSGGEKALTAVALVFAIFELNPAPFCLLDEVDAPLDDANVGRFSQLVREMSGKVQFLFISHNKVTMEIAQHLAGVTMKEPGVSRIVAVDIAEAVELAAA
jgi:chromosome segregation protein